MTNGSLISSATILALFAAATPAAAEPFAYYTTSDSLERLDLATGAVELILLNTGGSEVLISSMAFSPEGVLYALDSLEGRVLVIDPQTGQTQLVGFLGWRASPGSTA